jgi:5-methylcytosine-specific restriction protein A
MPWANDRESRRRSAAGYGAAYRLNRDERMRRASWRCEIRLEGVCILAASECDHIVSVADGGGHELSNLRAACGPCHASRTAQQGGGFRNGKQGDPPPSPRTQW